MVRSQEDASVRQDVFGAVAEFILALAGDQLSSLQVVEIGFEADPSQGNDDAQIFEFFEFACEKGRAVGQFLRQMLVVGRGAADSSGDIEPGEHLAIVASGRGGQQGKAGFVQHRVHKGAGGVSGERPACSIGTVGARRESENEDACVGIAEAGNGLAPVLAVAVSAALLAGYALAIHNQTWTARAGYDLGVQNLDPTRSGHSVSLYLFVWRGHSCPRLLLLLFRAASPTVPWRRFRCTPSRTRVSAPHNQHGHTKHTPVTLVGRTAPSAV